MILENPLGITLYAQLSIDRPNRKIPVHPTRDFDGITATARGWKYHGVARTPFWVF